MKCLVFFSLLGSMLAVTRLVNAQVEHVATARPAAGKDDVTQLVDFLLKNGEDSFFKEHLAPAIGLPGPMPVKGRTIAEEHHGKDKSVHECYLVYAQSADNRQPVCLYLKKRVVAGHDDQAEFFRINLNGRLEKAVVISSKRDDDGKIIEGAGASRDQDIQSAGLKKEFSVEMAAMKKWLKAQQKATAKAGVTAS